VWAGASEEMDLGQYHFYVAQFNCDGEKPMIEEAEEVKG